MDAEAPPQPAQQPANPSPAPQPQPANVPAQPNPPAQAQPANPVQPQAQGGNAAFGMTEDQIEDRINDLIAITGTDRENALAALRAAFFDVNTAANFVFEGIPEGGAGNAGLQAGQAGGQIGGQYGAGDGGEGDDGQDVADSPEVQQLLNEINQLTQNPVFQQIRQQARTNPQAVAQIVPQLMEYLRTSNPNVYEALQHNPNLLATLLLGGGAGGQGGAGGAGGRGGQRGNVVYLTQEENDAIERLMSLGFDKNSAAQAYLSCDKNEEMAANFLLENAADWGSGDAPQQPGMPQGSNSGVQQQPAQQQPPQSQSQSGGTPMEQEPINPPTNPETQQPPKDDKDKDQGGNQGQGGAGTGTGNDENKSIFE